MTLYLVKHSENDFKLHQEDGTVLGTNRTERPDKREMANILAEEYGGSSIMGNETARSQYTDVVAGAVNYRDLTFEQETVPWQ